MKMHNSIKALCLLVFLSLVLDMGTGWTIKKVIKAARKRYIKFHVVLINCTTADKPRAIWMDKEGRAIEEIGDPLSSQKEEKRVTKVIVRNGPATVIIDTGIKWVSLTIDTSAEDKRQTYPFVPPLECQSDLKYRPKRSRNDRKIPFVVQHPALSAAEKSSENPFESLPFVWDVKFFSWNNQFYEDSYSGTGYFNWGTTEADPEMPSAERSTFTFSTDKATSTGIVTLKYIQSTPNELVQQTEVGCNVMYYPRTESGPFSPGQLEVSKEYMRSQDYVKCYNPNYKCEVDCFGVSGNSGLNVTIYKLNGNQEEALVTANQVDGEPLARVAFPVLPDGSNSQSLYRCKATDSSGQVKSQDIKVNFNTFLSVDSAASSVTKKDDGSYAVLCVVKGFPYASSVDLVFTSDKNSDDASTKVKVIESYSNPDWRFTEVRGTLSAEQAQSLPGDVVGVRCSPKRASGSAYSNVFIDYVPE